MDTPYHGDAWTQKSIEAFGDYNFKNVYYTSQDHEGKFTWSDGMAVTTAFWAKGEPNNGRSGQDCAVVNYQRPGIWDDQMCNRHNPFVCQVRF